MLMLQIIRLSLVLAWLLATVWLALGTMRRPVEPAAPTHSSSSLMPVLWTLFCLYLSFVAVFGGDYFARVGIAFLAEADIIHLSEQTPAARDTLYLAVGLLLGLPLLVYDIRLLVLKLGQAKCGGPSSSPVGRSTPASNCQAATRMLRPWCRRLLISYLIAAYASRVPACFIDWQEGPPDLPAPHSLLGDIIILLLIPATTPFDLFVETYLAFAWGILDPVRLLPLLTFAAVLTATLAIPAKPLQKAIF